MSAGRSSVIKVKLPWHTVIPLYALGTVASTRSKAASTGISVGVWPHSPTAVTSLRSAPCAMSRRSAAASARDQAAGSCSTRPCPARTVR